MFFKWNLQAVVNILIMNRYFNIFLASVGVVIMALPFLVIMLLIKITSSGPVLYWSDRVGKNNKIFKMPKFRTMQRHAPVVATHLLSYPEEYLTPIGKFLRVTSFDELPQLWSILKGDMSFVGPRPALFNQDDLVELRTQCGVHKLVPGLTGWAQISGRDELPIPKKVRIDSEYLKRRSFWFDIYILLKTLVKVLKREDVSH